jgi:hypothetical protein
MNKDFFICKEPTYLGGGSFWGINLNAIESYVYTPDQSELCLMFEKGGDISLSGEDALRLLQAMGLGAAATFLPKRGVEGGQNPLIKLGRKCGEREITDAIELPEPSWVCPLGEGDDRCTDLSQCARYQQCAELQDRFGSDWVDRAKALGISPEELLRRAKIAQGEEDDEDVCPLGPGDFFCDRPIACEKYDDCVDAARAINRDLGLLVEDDDD